MAWLSGGAQRHPLSQLSLGGGGGDGADYRIVDRPALHPDAAHAAGKGTADPRRRTAEPSREKGHADDGRADDPDRADDLGAALDGLVEPLRLGLPVRDRRDRKARLYGRSRQGYQGQPSRDSWAGAPAARKSVVVG